MWAEALEAAFRRAWRIKVASQPFETATRGPLESSEALERGWWYELVRDCFDELGQLNDFGDRFDAFFDHLFDHFAHPAPWHVFSDVRPALERLRAMGIRLAVVSNWDSRLPLLLERLGLGQYFEFVLTSAKAGRRKPDPAIFREALERLNLPPDQVAHVGDSIEEDIAGARRAGLRAVLLDRDGRHNDPPVERISSLEELPAHLGLG